MAEKEKAQGIIRTVSITEGTKQNGDSWKRASIKIEKDGREFTVSTFNSDDIDKSNSLNGKGVEVTYTKSQDEKYKNLEKNGIKEVEIIETKIEAIKPKAEVNWDLKNKRQFRAMCISYAKDLAVAGKIETDEIKIKAQLMFEFVWEGYNGDIPTDPEEEEIVM